MINISFNNQSTSKKKTYVCALTDGAVIDFSVGEQLKQLILASTTIKPPFTGPDLVREAIEKHGLKTVQDVERIFAWHRPVLVDNNIIKES